MVANLDYSNNRVNFAFTGARDDIWHREGNEMRPGQSMLDWIAESGLGFEAIYVPAIANLAGEKFDHLPPSSRFQVVPERGFIARADTGALVSTDTLSDRFKIVQPRETIEVLDDLIQVDPRFQMTTAGSLGNGYRVWAQAEFAEPLSVAGDKHSCYMLATTCLDGSGSTIVQLGFTRAVCQNTVTAALFDKSCRVSVRHSTVFDKDMATKKLATIAKGIQRFKACGDAMAQVQCSKDQVRDLFKKLLDIPFEVKAGDVSTRKMNQYEALVGAYSDTVSEGTQAETVWTAFNAVTRYVDHEKSAKGDSRLESVQFGHGAQMKDKAIDLLMPLIRNRILITA